MKYNFLTAFLAILMVVTAVGIMLGAMAIYEKDKFDESWLLSPAVIERELEPLYNEEFDINSTEY